MELRSWRRAYGAQIVAPAYGAQILASGLWSSDPGNGSTELRLWQRAYEAQIVAPAYGAQIVATGLWSSVCLDRGVGLQSSARDDGPRELRS